MISHIDIKNYRCLRDVSVPLKPLTVLIGANDTGKSTFLNAICTLISNAGIIPSDFWRGDESQFASMSGQSELGDLVAERDAASQSWRLTPKHIARAVGYVAKYQLPSNGVSILSGGVPDSASVPDLSESGENLAGLLDHVLRTDRSRLASIEAVLQRLVPGFERLDIRTPSAELRRIDLIIDGGFHLSGERASAGLRLLLFFVALAYHPQPPRTICIEEPELGVHPKRLADVIKLLREITKGEHAGHPAQVILTTHSPYLLDLIDPEEDQVLVFRRESDGSRSATPVNAAGLAEFLDEFKLGEVWYNEGEDRLIGKPVA